MKHLLIIVTLSWSVCAFGVGAGLQGGTTGIGPVVVFPLSEEASLRIGIGFLSLKREEKVDDLVYDIDASLRWFPMLIDYNPGSSLFRITGGLFANRTTADASYEPESSIEIGGHMYTPANIGKVAGEITMQPLSPYLGIGIGSGHDGSSTLRLLLDGGIAFTGYKVELSHEGGNLPPGLEEQFADDLQLEADSLEDSLNDLKVYPVLSAGLIISW